jgi:2-hydroxychromene-2-carboxylate isomerase
LLAARRGERHEPEKAFAAPRAVRTVFSFDLSSPFTYLAAERVDRRLPGVVWRPVLEEVMQTPPPARALAEERAVALSMPIVWPEFDRGNVRPAMRVASLAAERGRAAAFVLAATRLAFCGGYELDSPDVLAEAAAAANLGLEDCLRAAGDPSRDGPMEDAARRLLAQGADQLPAVRVGRLLFAGEHRLTEAFAAAQAPSAHAV